LAIFEHSLTVLTILTLVTVVTCSKNAI